MTVRVMLSIPEDFLEEVDRVARQEFRSRSELLREALRRYLEERRKGPDSARKVDASHAPRPG